MGCTCKGTLWVDLIVTTHFARSVPACRSEPYGSVAIYDAAGLRDPFPADATRGTASVFFAQSGSRRRSGCDSGADRGLSALKFLMLMIFRLSRSSNQ